jgi:DNA-binding transcriptional MerR regulator
VSRFSHDELVTRLNDWCLQHKVAPANGQAAETVSARTLRYYRTTGLMDAPLSGKGQGYGERHFLQAAAVRVLQAQGLPLNRIHALLFGRSDADLRRVMKEGIASAASVPSRSTAVFHAPETWNVLPLDEDWMLVSRRGALVSADTMEKIRQLLAERSFAAP